MFPDIAPLLFIRDIATTAAGMAAIYFVSRFIFMRKGGIQLRHLLPENHAWLTFSISFFLFYAAAGIHRFGIDLPISKITLIEYNVYVIATNTTEIFCYVVAASVPWLFNWPEEKMKGDHEL